MIDSELTNSIFFSYSNEDITPSRLVKKIIAERGSEFVEQKFSFIVDCVNKSAASQILTNHLYSEIFPDLVPTRRGMKAVFQNSIASAQAFKPLFHRSEFIYRQWLRNFDDGFIGKIKNGVFIPNISNCSELYNEYKFWTKSCPEIKGNSIKNSIKWELGELPLNQPIEYLPKDTSLQRNIIQQLKSSGVMQMTGRNDIIELKFDHSRILLTRKSKYVLKADALQRWLGKFGLEISLVTATHLVEFGMPYAGEIYPMHAMLRFTNNGHGIIGLLAYELALLVKKNSTDPFHINDINHPLSQSVVLALSRVEHYLNPSLV